MTPSPTTLRPTPTDGVVRSADLLRSGVSAHALAARCRPSGSWQRLFPGVVLLTNTPPSRRQRIRAALTYAGADAILTGTDAMRLHGLRPPPTEEVMVLIPATRRVTSRAYLTVERTTRMPTPVHKAGFPLAPLVRATVDAARRQHDRERLKSLLYHPIQEGACTASALHRELEAGNQRGSAAVRALLNTRDHQVVPVTQALARRVLQSAPLPPPHWQVPLHTPNARMLGIADAWWPQAGLAWNLGAQPHPLPTTEQARPLLTKAGITVLDTDPTRLRTTPTTVITELVKAFSYASTNPHRQVIGSA